MNDQAVARLSTSWVPRVVFGILIAVTVLGAAGRASRKLLWHDEVLTVTILQQPLDQLGPMLRRGIDLTPPLFHLITETGYYVPVTESLRARLTSILAFVICLGALYMFASYRGTRWHGLVAALVAAGSGAHTFAYEARPYALLLAFAAAAFVCWQRAADEARSTRRRTVLVFLAAFIACAVSTHYYGALIALALGAGELVRLLQRGKVDWPVSAAIAAGVAPLLAFLDFIRAGAAQAGSFFSPPHWRVTIEAYELYGSPLIIPTLLALAASAAVMAVRSPLVRADSEAVTTGPATPPHEWIVCITLLLLPPIALVLATLTATGYAPRYTLIWTLGLALTAGLLSQSIRQRVVATGVIAFALWIGMRDAQGARHLLLPPVDVHATFAALHQLPDGDIAVAHSHVFTQLQYYLPPPLRQRVVFVQRPPGVPGGDTGGIAIREVSRWRPMTITDVESLIQRPHFYLYTPHDWLVERLIRAGADLQLLGVDLAETPFAVSRPGALSLYEVRMPQQQGRHP